MFSVGDVNVKGLKQFENMLGALGNEGPKVQAHAVNRTGDMARTKVVRVLAKQTGLPQKTIRKSLKVKRAMLGSQNSGTGRDLTYTIRSAGGDVSLKYFKPRETRKGVSAFVRGQRQLFESTFIKGGSFVRGRVALNMGGHVFLRVGGRHDLEKQKSGVFIPNEMVTGATAAAFESTVEDVLPRRLSHELSRALGL